MKRKSIWNSIKEHKYIIGLLLISIIVISGYTFFIELKSNDILWNLSNIYKMYNGGKIYNDCNVITTPIFFCIGLLLFKFLGANFVTFGIYNVIIFTIFEYLVYKLFYTLNSNQKKSFIEAILMLIYILVIIPTGANYNILVLDFVILGILANIKLENSKWVPFIQGFICFMVVFTKQNIGVFYILALISYNLYSGIESKNIKYHIIITIKEMLVFVMTSIVLLLTMCFYGNLNQFINFAILGIGEFAAYNLSSTIFTIIPEIFTVIFMILMGIITLKILDIDKEKRKNLIILTIFGIAMMIYMYPIFNLYHLVLANTIIAIMCIYWVDLILEKIKINKKINIVLYWVFIIVITVLIGKSLYNIYSICEVSDKNDWVYKGIYISEETNNKIKTICNYIEDRKKNKIDVKIISYKALLYMTPLKMNNREFDLPLYGNLGKEGYRELINQIANFENTEILITKDEEDKCAQEPIEVRKYIIDNLKKIGEIEEFAIYKIP